MSSPEDIAFWQVYNCRAQGQCESLSELPRLSRSQYELVTAKLRTRINEMDMWAHEGCDEHWPMWTGECAGCEARRESWQIRIQQVEQFIKLVRKIR